MWDGKTERRQDNSSMLQWLSEFGTDLRNDVKETIDNLKCDIKVVKADVRELDDKVSDINTKMVKFESQVFDDDTGIINLVKDHDRVIYGNGHPGLLKELTELKTKFMTGIAIAIVVGGIFGWVITLVVSLFK